MLSLLPQVTTRMASPGLTTASQPSTFAKVAKNVGYKKKAVICRGPSAISAPLSVTRAGDTPRLQ